MKRFVMKRFVWILLVFVGVLATQAANAAQAGCGNRARLSTGNRLNTILALTQDQRLLRFQECSTRLREIGSISGLQGSDSALVGMDFRVQDGLLYGVGNGGGLYTIDTDSALATPAGQLTVVLSGTSFGVDFNPAANALRIISDTGQNLRHPSPARWQVKPRLTALLTMSDRQSSIPPLASPARRIPTTILTRTRRRHCLTSIRR